MIIDKVELENFGPFHATHVLELATDSSSPITLVHGENMRGKTTLLNAIRWCLYGDLIESERAGTELYELLNYDARDAGNFFFSVRLTFEHDDYLYELERQAQLPDDATNDSHLKTTVYLKRGGQVLPADSVQEEINNILHQEVSRFFLFDGEMLQHYEALVRSSDPKTNLVKRSIERILGLPALRLAVDDLDAMRKSASKKQRKAVAKKKDSRKLIAECEALEDEIEGLEQDLEKLEDQRENIEARRQRLRDQRKQHAAVQEEAARLERLEEEIDEWNSEREDLVEECRSHLREGWWQVLVPSIRILRVNLEDEVQGPDQFAIESALLGEKLDQIEQGIEEGMCPLCQSDLDEKHLAQLEAQLDSTKQELQHREEAQERDRKEGVLRGRLARLRRFDSMRELVLLEEKEERIQELDIKIRGKKRTCEDIREALREYDIPEIRRIESELDEAIGELRLLEKDINKQEQKLAERQSELAGKQDKVDRLPDADPRIAAEATCYSVLLDSFTEALDRFREKLREQVESEASAIFQELTTESEYDGLVINDKYGLDIVDNEGRFIHRRSKGAEQVVALSLIAALNRCAVREGPVIMDTPFGRLDEGHRANIITFLPSLGTQVVVLVQSGEWGGEEDTALLESKLGRELAIVKDGKPTRSRVADYSEVRESNG